MRTVDQVEEQLRAIEDIKDTCMSENAAPIPSMRPSRASAAVSLWRQQASRPRCQRSRRRR